MHVCVCVGCVVCTRTPLARRSPQMPENILSPRTEVITSCVRWELWTKPRSSARTVSSLDPALSLQLQEEGYLRAVASLIIITYTNHTYMLIILALETKGTHVYPTFIFFMTVLMSSIELVIKIAPATGDSGISDACSHLHHILLIQSPLLTLLISSLCGFEFHTHSICFWTSPLTCAAIKVQKENKRIQ